MALAACMLTDCVAEDSAVDEVSKTTAEIVTEADTETEAETAVEMREETFAGLNEVTTGTDPLDTAAAFVIESPKPDEEAIAEVAKRPEVTNYKLNYVENEFVSEEQSALAEFLIYDTDFGFEEFSRAESEAYDNDTLDDFQHIGWVEESVKLYRVTVRTPSEIYMKLQKMLAFLCKLLYTT